MTRTPFTHLQVWQKSMQLTKDVYEATRHFPKEEMYGLTSQMRRSAVSVPSNIAEGNRRTSENEYAHFLSIAMGSCAELETQIRISTSLAFFDVEKSNSLILQTEEISKMLSATVKTIRG